MKHDRVRIDLTFEVDLDMFPDSPGWGHTPADWVELVQKELSRNAHSITINSVKEVKA